MGLLLWLLLVPIGLAALAALVIGCRKMNASLRELKSGIAELGSAGVALKKVQGELDEWRATLDKTRRH